ncbi:MAG TPA: hypothetical protein VGC22_00390 [Chitinophaga sp.]
MNLIRIGLVAWLLTGTVRVCAQHVMTTAAATSLRQPITKTVPAADLAKALRKAGKGPLFVEVYPVKKTAAATKSDFDALVLLRDAKNTSYPFKTVNAGNFDTQAAHYVDYYRGQKLARENIPFGYRVAIDKARATGSLGLTVDVAKGAISLAYPGYTYVCDSCKCPPQCSSPGTPKLLYRTRMEHILNTSYLKK